MIPVRVIISHLFNFFAEALLASLRPAPTWIFHVNKTDEQVEDFRQPPWVDRVVVLPNSLQHGELLDQILIERRWPDLLGADALVFLDHDFLVAGSDFDAVMGKMLVACIASGCAVVSKHPCFQTVPAFAVDPRTQWPCSWQPQWGRNLDTGQAIAVHESMRGCVGVFDWPLPWLMHWTGNYVNFWCCEPRADAAPWMPRVLAEYKRLGATGLWKPKECDIPKIAEYPMLARVLGIKPIVL